MTTPIHDTYKYKVSFVALHITQACTHACPFCYASSSMHASEADYATLQKVINAIAEAGVAEVAFLGGDPCEYLRLLDLAMQSKLLGLRTGVLSNTHDYRQAGFKSAVKWVDNFETTFHGPTPFDHDSIAMKDGAFEHVIKNLHEIAREGAQSLGVVYNITPINYLKMYQTVEVLLENYKLPIDHLVLQRIVPLGRARGTSKFTIGSAQAIAALEDVERIVNNFRLSVFFEDPFPFCVIPERFHKYLSRCEWGYSRVSVNSKGDISRCGADTRYRLGNILQTPLLVIWNTSPLLKSFRSKEYLPDDCRSCKYLDKCGGGCGLSCEIELDHSADYMYFERRAVQVVPGTQPSLVQANRDDLSDILRMEWACFPAYEFKFSPAAIQKWYGHNRHMFYKLQDSTERMLGYACIVPLTKSGYVKIVSGAACSLLELDFSDVAKNSNSTYWHLEVIGSVSAMQSRAGRALIRQTGELLLSCAKVVTASPVTEIGLKLCRYFGFEVVASKRTSESTYQIYRRGVEDTNIRKTLDGF